MRSFNLEFKKKPTSLVTEKGGVVAEQRKTTSFRMLEEMKTPLKIYLIEKEEFFHKMVEALIDKHTKNNNDIAKILSFAKEKMTKESCFTKMVRIDAVKFKKLSYFLEENGLQFSQFLNFYISQKIKKNE